MDVLKVKDLNVRVGDSEVLRDIDLKLEENQSYILFGPNGSGKTTLINAIMGVPGYEIEAKEIQFIGNDISEKSVEERAKLGMSVSFQHPPEITGVKLSDLLKLCLGKDSEDQFSEEEKRLIETFNLTDFLDRDINVGFSGGERKRAEILQIIFLKPKLLLLDEPDSGVDVESLSIIAKEIQRYMEKTGSSALIITHKGDILEYIESKYACVLLKSKMYCFADPKSIYESIKSSGYQKCVKCECRVTEEW
ncbi:MAG: ABC transporter ATP-binding protein [Thermoproteota archaeon]